MIGSIRFDKSFGSYAAISEFQGTQSQYISVGPRLRYTGDTCCHHLLRLRASPRGKLSHSQHWAVDLMDGANRLDWISIDKLDRVDKLYK